MFTNEFNETNTVTTILDEEGNFEDLIVEITDDIIYIKQYNDSAYDDIPDFITVSPKMFKDLLTALHKPEGFYKTKYQRNNSIF